MVDISAIEIELNEAEYKAWDALSRYKFQQFGYWAAIWVHLNRLGEFNRPNPFKRLVKSAQVILVKNVRQKIGTKPDACNDQSKKEPF